MKRFRTEVWTLSSVLVALGATAACSSTVPQPTSRPGSTQGPGNTANSEPTAEQQRAVDAFTGEWVYHATITPPGAAPIRTDLVLSCSKTAGGRANVCSFTGDVPGMESLEGGILVGLNRLDGKVHFMAMTSDDELHDHVCAWRDTKNLVCDPLRAGLGGQPVTEDLSFTFNAEEGSFKSVTRFADGKQMLFDASGRKGPTSAARRAPLSKGVEVSAEQKKLVESFLGKWNWDAEIVFPDGSRGRASLDLQCRATAGSKASLCTLGAKDIAGRPYEAAILVGHDPLDKAVHFMMMSSDDEVWSRSCSWKGDKVLACGPMRTGVMGMPVTSELTFDFAGAKGKTRWVTDLGDGKTCLLTASMSR